MVIPRSRSSGALSMESNARNCTLGLCLLSTLVIAAVSVVFPWSMCPIVPTFTCGLLRSNFSFAMSASAPQRVLVRTPLTGSLLPQRLPCGLGDDLFSHLRRRFLVVRKMHSETSAALRAAAEVSGIPEHGGQRHLRGDDLASGARFAALNLTAARVQVANHIAHVFLGYHHFDAHHRLEQRGLRAMTGFLEAH